MEDVDPHRFRGSKVPGCRVAFRGFRGSGFCSEVPGCTSRCRGLPGSGVLLLRPDSLVSEPGTGNRTKPRNLGTQPGTEEPWNQEPVQHEC